MANVRIEGQVVPVTMTPPTGGLPPLPATEQRLRQHGIDAGLIAVVGGKIKGSEPGSVARALGESAPPAAPPSNRPKTMREILAERRQQQSGVGKTKLAFGKPAAAAAAAAPATPRQPPAQPPPGDEGWDPTDDLEVDYEANLRTPSASAAASAAPVTQSGVPYRHRSGAAMLHGLAGFAKKPKG